MPHHRFERRSTRLLVRCTAALSLYLAAMTGGGSSVGAIAYPHGQVEWSAAPWTASILRNDAAAGFAPLLVCTGALIGQRYVITAAHCVDGVAPVKLHVGFGTTDLRSGGIYGVEDVVVHPKYRLDANGGTVSHDLAVLLLTAAVTDRTPIQPVAAGDTTTGRTPYQMALYGFGVDHADVSSGRLAYARQRDYTKIAQHYFPTFDGVHQLAAGWRRSNGMFASACFGDSGGPLVGTGSDGTTRLVGVVSYGAKRCDRRAPSVFTNVAAYQSWLVEAQAALQARAGSRPLVYTSDDADNDAEGAAAAGVELLDGAISVNRTAIDITVRSTSAPVGTTVRGVFLVPMGTDPIATFTATGVSLTGSATERCPPTVRISGTTVSVVFDAQCIVSLIGRAATVGISVRTGAQPPSFDWVFFEQVAFPAR